MNIFNLILKYFKKWRSQFLKLGQKEKTIGESNEIKNIRLEEIGKELHDFVNKNGKSTEQINEILQEKTSIELDLNRQNKSKKNPQKRKLVFDLAVIEQEVMSFNQKLLDIKTKSKRIEFISISPKSQLDEEIEELDKLCQTFNSKSNLQSLIEIPTESINADSFFEEFRLIKIFRTREERQAKEEVIKKQKVRELTQQLEQTINLDKLHKAKQSIRDVENAILGLRVPEQKTKFREKLSSLREIFRKRVIEEEVKRQEANLKREKEAAERNRKAEEARIEADRKRGVIIDDTSKNSIVSQVQIEALYHMTDLANLESILKYGLLSHTEAHTKNVVKRDISDNAVNSRRQRLEPINHRSIHDYVPLYFNPKNPMLYVRKDLQSTIVILEIDKRLIYQAGNLFTDGNAASNPTRFYNKLNDLDRIDWTCLRRGYWNDYPDGKRIRCAEVLAYPKVLNKYIEKIYCNNITTKNKTQEIINKFDLKVSCSLSSKLFF